MRIVVETDNFDEGFPSAALRYFQEMNNEGKEYAENPEDLPVDVSTTHMGFSAFIVGILESNGNITLAIGED